MAEIIKIERSERKCPYNDDVRSGKIKDHPIYDWNVLIDGEYRAQFHPGVYKGYNLHDPDGFPIKGASDKGAWSRRSDVAAKAEFEPKIRECLAKGIIPTLAQLSEARAERQRKQEARKAAELEYQRIERIKTYALEMAEYIRSSAAAGCATAKALVEKFDAAEPQTPPVESDNG